jgi:hypothetical protein
MVKKEKELTKCLVDNTGILIGLISAPPSQELQFYENEFEKELFKNYKKNLRSLFVDEQSPSYLKEFDDSFYIPKSYFVFGKFDLAILSLVDGYEFSSRAFRPFEPLMKKGEKTYKENFIHQIILGPTPKFRQRDSIIELASETFLSKDPFPLIGICQLKLNSYFTIGFGNDFLRSAIKLIKYFYQEFFSDSENKIIILESYSWHELTLLLFSNSYEQITKFILRLREITYGKMKAILKRNKELDEIQSLESGTSLNSRVIKNVSDKFNIDKNHIFENSTSIYGFDSKIYKEIKRGLNTTLDKIDRKDKIFPFCRWFTKAGHLKKAIDKVSHKDSNRAKICVGRGDFIYPLIPNKSISTREFLRTICSVKMKRNLHLDTIASYTTLIIEDDINDLEKVSKGHLYFHDNLMLGKYSVEQVMEISTMLRALNVPKIIITKITNMFANFNDGIQDPILFASFYELKPYMEVIIETIRYYYRKRDQYFLEDLCDVLNKSTDIFEKAYQNRFYAGYRMSEITDFNITFKGGIQQLVSSFDGAYKIISDIIGNPESVTYVGGDTGIKSTEYSIRLNYFHIFQPETFAVLAVHEAANFMFSKRRLSGFPDFKKFLVAFSQDTADFHIKEALKRIPLKNYLEKNLSEYINKNFFHYIMADYLSYYFTFNKNFSLFSYWFLNYFSIISPDHYLKSNKLKETHFISFLFRIISIIKSFENHSYQKFLKNFSGSTIKPMIDKWLEPVNNFYDLLLNEERFRNWFQDAKKITQEFVRDVNKNILKKKSNNLKNDLEKIRNSIEKKAIDAQNHIDEGFVYSYSKSLEKNLNEFQFIQVLFYAYLSLLMNKWKNGNSSLIRNSMGIPIVSKKDSHYLFDPMGGVFIHGAEHRRNYFKYRSAFMVSLWDVAYKHKEYLLSDLYSGNS